MYFEEKIINGELFYRYSPNDDFTPYTLSELTRLYRVQRHKVNVLKDENVKLSIEKYALLSKLKVAALTK